MSKVKQLCLCALFTAFICICSVVCVPVFAVPITLSVFAITLCALVLELKYALISVLGFIALGCVGLPVFSSFTGGVGVLFSYTGGFIYSYVFMVIIISLFAKSEKLTLKILGCTLALIVCYICGVTHYSIVANVPFFTAFSLVLGFVVFDVIKISLALLISQRIKSILK